MKQCEVAAYFDEVLMLEGFIHAEIVGSPTEVGGCSWFHTSAGAAGDGCDVDIAGEHPFGCEGQESKLDSCGETARVGHEAARFDALALPLGQTINVALAFVAEVLGEVDDAQAFGRLRPCPMQRNTTSMPVRSMVSVKQSDVSPKRFS